MLADSEPVSSAVTATVLSELGWPMTSEEAGERWIGRSWEDVTRDAHARLGALPDDFFERYQDGLLAAYADHLRPVAGVRAAVAAIGLPDAVASNGERGNVRASLERIGLLEHFDGRIHSGVEEGRPKPAPDVYLRAARDLGVAPAACAAVEDTPTGARAAVAAGMTVFGYAGATPAAALAEVGARPFARMEALPGLIAAGRESIPASAGAVAPA